MREELEKSGYDMILESLKQELEAEEAKRGPKKPRGWGRRSEGAFEAIKLTPFITNQVWAKTKFAAGTPPSRQTRR